MHLNRRTLLSLTAAAIAAPGSTPAFAAPAPLQDGPPNEPKPVLQNIPKGRIETLPHLDPANQAEPRIRIWLPHGYDQSLARHQTLYMLDGQYVFEGDSEGMNSATDKRVAWLMASETIAPTLIIAIDNLGDERFLQYMPQAIYDRAERDEALKGLRATVDRERNRLGGKPLVSNDFVRFLETRLKPYVDAHYRTAPDRNHTAIFGASQAGVMAGAIFVEAQKSFGRAGCMSPNWAIYDERFLNHEALPGLWGKYFAQLGAANGRRIWLDHGSKMMDAGMLPHQKAIAGALTHLGWERGCNLQTRIYDTGHAFAQTAVQLDDMLAWLLG